MYVSVRVCVVRESVILLVRPAGDSFTRVSSISALGDLYVVSVYVFVCISVCVCVFLSVCVCVCLSLCDLYVS